MKKEHFKGIFPYLVTPLDDKGRLKEKVLAELVDHLIRKGVHGLTPLGSTGEGDYFDWPTKKRVVEVVVEAAGGRVPVVAGVNNITTHGAVREAAETERIGADGILVSCQTCNVVIDMIYFLHNQPRGIEYEEIHCDTYKRRT